MNVRMSTLHTPKNLRAAEVTAGYGLKESIENSRLKRPWPWELLP